MSNETEGVFTFTWSSGSLRKYTSREKYEIQSPPFEAKTLKNTIWCLKLYLNVLYPGAWKVNLCRVNDGISENISATTRLELIDAFGTILKSIVEENCIFPSNSEGKFIIDSTSLGLNRKKDDDSFMEHVVTVRCHIMDECYKRRAMAWEIPNMSHTQWIINTPGPENWTKKIKVPFHECTHIDIIMSASDETINIKSYKVDFIKPYILKIRILNDKNREVVCNGIKNFIGSTSENQSLETWIKKSHLVDKSRFHLPYSFTLVCRISISNANSVLDIDSDFLDNYFPSLKDPRLPLQEDLKKMLLNDKHSDIKLQSHDKIIPAHKCLLSARSPVFSTMFDQDMLETHTGVVDISDIESETLQSFLEFLYCDTITNTVCDEVLKLMLVADKYQVDVLKERCSQILITKLSVENICQVVSVSEMVNHSELKLAAISFIRENKKEIISSTIWSEWMKKNLELANELLMKLIVV